MEAGTKDDRLRIKFIDWWGDARYGDNDDTQGSEPEVAAGHGSSYTDEQYHWGPHDDQTDLDCSVSATLTVPNAAGKVEFKLDGDTSSVTVTHPAEANVRIGRVDMIVGAAAGTTSEWLNVTAIFYRSDGGTPWTQPIRSGPACDGTNDSVNDPTCPPADSITPPALPSGVHYNKVVFQGVIHLFAYARVYPAGKLSAAVNVRQ